MRGGPPDADPLETEALVSDGYLHSLLAGHQGRLAGDLAEGAAGSELDLDPSVREAADLLRRTLIRVHPSFRFEEGLAARLAASGRSLAGGSTGGATVIPLGLPRIRSTTDQRDAPATRAPATDPARRAGRLADGNRHGRHRPRGRERPRH